ncbi:hypothetical protein CSKR_103306 [Clonorchis sinensis]|uniref:Uncharacterized protein n=1 Tax=Clonorchis sinensis TaxID=79923 RepID=A0A3R7H0H0_CLOSI|nr:hypothetical protein CSKR_103306 [Clonorchis sinensis]
MEHMAKPAQPMEYDQFIYRGILCKCLSLLINWNTVSVEYLQHSKTGIGSAFADFIAPSVVHFTGYKPADTVSVNEECQTRRSIAEQWSRSHNQSLGVKPV